MMGGFFSLEWRNWQTHGTQNPAPFTGHVGSTPTSSTTIYFCLGRGFIGKWPYVEISPAEFNSLETAKDNLFTVIGVEEKFDMLLRNYVEYERTLLTLALE